MTVDPLGIVLALSAGGSYALFSALSKNLLDKKSPDAVMAVVFSLGGLMMVPILFRADLSWLITGPGVLTAFHLGFVATSLSYFLYARGLNQVPVATATTLALGEPMTAGTLGILVVGERLTAQSIIGIGAILAGLLILTLSPWMARRLAARRLR